MIKPNHVVSAKKQLNCSRPKIEIGKGICSTIHRCDHVSILHWTGFYRMCLSSSSCVRASGVSDVFVTRTNGGQLLFWGRWSPVHFEFGRSLTDADQNPHPLPEKLDSGHTILDNRQTRQCFQCQHQLIWSAYRKLDLSCLEQF